MNVFQATPAALRAALTATTAVALALVLSAMPADAQQKISVTLRNVASHSVTFQITDVVCNISFPVTLQPWQEWSIPICSDSGYGKIIYRDIRNSSGVEASFLRDGDNISV